LFDEGTDPTGYLEVMNPLTTFYNTVMRGEQWLSIMEMWTTGRAVLIPKIDDEDNQCGWRSIPIGDSFYRHFRGTILATFTTDMPTHHMQETKVLQLGINTPGRCEIGSRLAQVCYDYDNKVFDNEETMSIIKVDLENVFPSIPRGTVFEGIQRYVPGLCSIMRMLYGHSSKMFSSAGEPLGHCKTGVRQGCLLAMLFFSLGCYPTLEKTHETMEEIKLEASSRLPAGGFGFVDDIFAYIGHACAHEVAARIRDIIAETGMNIKTQKCSILVQPGQKDEAERIKEGRHDFNITDTGLIILGNTIGT
jgi:hypothetical protein